MKLSATKFALGAVLIFLPNANFLNSQEVSGTLSGTVADSSAKALPNAKVSVKNVATGEISDTMTDAQGHYRFANLAAGEYEISAVVEGSGTASAKVTLAAGTEQEQRLTLNQAQTAPSTPPSAPENPPDAPSSSQSQNQGQPQNQGAPSLADLGFSKAEEQGNARQQALLDKRTHMLKIHQRMGLITTIPMIASVVTSLNAGGRSEGTASRDLHVALGALTGDLYGITAYYAIRAPKIEGTETRGPIKFHKIMAWIHGPGMIATPILGAIAFSQKNNGEKVHGIAQLHGPVAIVTAGAFGAALLSVSFKF